MSDDLLKMAPDLIGGLRHPLQGIKASLELVERRVGALAGLEEWKLMRRQVQRMQDFLSSYEAVLSREKAASSFFVVDEVVEQAVGVLEFRVNRLGGRFDARRAPTPKVAWCAPSAVLHAIVDVVANAVDAAEAAGGSARVQVRVVGGGGSGVEVRVSHEGRGVSPHIAGTMMRNYGGSVRLVEEGDPARLNWARTEFSVGIPARPD